jgi:hypothetical protein
MFKDLFGDTITSFVKSEDRNIVEYIYRSYDIIGEKTTISDAIIAYTTDEETITIKDRMYCLDFWIFENIKDKLIASGILVHYESPLILGLFAILKETLF